MLKRPQSCDFSLDILCWVAQSCGPPHWLLEVHLFQGHCLASNAMYGLLYLQIVESSQATSSCVWPKCYKHSGSRGILDHRKSTCCLSTPHRTSHCLSARLFCSFQ